MTDAAISLVILVATVALFVWNRLPVAIVALGAALATYATGLLEVEGALAGFGDPVVLFLASLFVVSEGIDSTGITAWAGQRVVRLVGDRPRGLLALAMVMSALLSALISPNGSVAALLPMSVVMAARAGIPASQMTMPLAFSASAGSLMVLTGTPVNLLVSDAAADAGTGGFGFFEFALVGVPLTIGSIGLILLVGQRVLPVRASLAASPDLSEHARTLVEHYALEGGLYRLRVRRSSPWSGIARDALDVRAYPELALIGVQPAQEGAGGASGSEGALAEGDVLVVRGDAAAVSRLVVDQVLAVAMAATPGDEGDGLLSRELGVAEIVIPPRSGLVGLRVFPGMRTPGGLVILAVQRLGRPRRVEVALDVGDTLLVQGTWDVLAENVESDDVLVVDSPEVIRRQAVPMGPRAKRAITILLVMIALLAFDVVPAAIAGLLAAAAMILARVVLVQQAYRAISWSTLVLIGGLIPLTQAIRETGAAAWLADGLLDVVGDAGPYALMAGIFVLIGALGQVVSNMATALIVIPIAVAAATEMGISPRPVLMLATVAAAASFLTPIATPANMMAMGPGGYRFGDYWKLGLPLMIWFFVVAMLLVPLIWPFAP